MSETIGSNAVSNSHAGFKTSKEVALPVKIHTSHRLVNLVDEMFYGRVCGQITFPNMEFVFWFLKISRKVIVCVLIYSLILQRNYNELRLSCRCYCRSIANRFLHVIVYHCWLCSFAGMNHAITPNNLK